MCAVAHFFGEDVGGIYLPSDVLDVERLVLHPFANGIITKLDMTRSFRSHVIGPFDAGLVIVVQKGRMVDIRNREARIGDASTDVAEVNDLL